MATGGINQFDLDIVKKALAENVTTTPPPPPPPGAQDRRARRASSGASGVVDFLKAGPGILARALQADRTLTGFPINQDKATRMNTLQDEIKKRADLQKSSNKRVQDMLMVMDKPFNQISIITKQLGLTGAWGIVEERIAAFPRPVGCVINVTYEVPLLQVEGIESYRVPVSEVSDESLNR